MMKKRIGPDLFANEEYRDYVIYSELASVESVPEFRRILEEFIEHEKGDWNFWRTLAKEREYNVSALEILFFKFIRKIFGFTFTVKLLEGREKSASKRYGAYLETVSDQKLKQKIEDIVAHERYHEEKLIGQIEEKRLKFVSSVVLGLNDGLIELTGALVGFSFALQNNILIALAGTITGVSASLSMAASAYMQARYEEGKDPKLAGFITGLSYITVVSLLIIPFFFFESVAWAVLSMAGVVLLILICVSLYSSVLLERPFPRQLGEMITFSIGAAAVAFLIGTAFWYFTDISLSGSLHN